MKENLFVKIVIITIQKLNTIKLTRICLIRITEMITFFTNTKVGFARLGTNLT